MESPPKIHFKYEKIITTDSAWVVLDKHCAWKILRPSHEPLRNNRKRLLHNELYLNQRFEVDLYIGLSCIGNEPALLMRRLDENLCLSKWVMNNTKPEAIGLAYRRITKKYIQHWENGDLEIPCKGSHPQKLGESMLQTQLNYDSSLFKNQRSYSEKVNVLQSRLSDWAYKHRSIIESRVNHFWVDGHGDLRLWNIFASSDKIWFIDSVPTPMFRITDILKDLAYLAIDIEVLTKTSMLTESEKILQNLIIWNKELFYFFTAKQAVVGAHFTWAAKPEDKLHYLKTAEQILDEILS